MTIFEPQFHFSYGAIAPDCYDTSLGLVPPDDFVVSRNRDGSIASIYGDMVWDLSAYGPDGRSRLLRFPYWNEVRGPSRELLNQEARWLMLLLMWKNELPLSFSSLCSYLGLIRAIAKFSDNNSWRMSEVLADSNRIIMFVNSGISGSNVVLLSSLLFTLSRLGFEQTGLNAPSRDVFKELQNRIEEYQYKTRQHPPIPARIYSEIVSGLAQELHDFEIVAEHYLTVVKLCSSDSLIGKCNQLQRVIAGRLDIKLQELRPDFETLLLKYGLHNYFLKKKLSRNVKGLSTGLACVQKTAKLFVQTFSGMRDSEALSLPYHCIESSASNGKNHYIILGRITKLNKGLIKRVRWVTNSEGHRAINIAMLIADTIYETLRDKPKKNISRINNYPLFISTSYLPLSGGKVSKKASGYLPSQLQPGSLTHFEKLKAQFMPVIEICDLNELESIDPHRSWRSEAKFKVGATWPLTSHQLRRSLALYAQRSGLVSLPSLRRQLQHITEEMSRYYARGSAFARNFIGEDKEHFGREWQDTGPISAALSYINVVFSEEPLFGGHSDWINNRLRGPDGNIAIDREETLRRFKKGELSYRETFLGGCTNISECKQTALKWLDVDCLAGCSNLVGKIAKLERAIAAQARLVSSLDHSSIEYRTEKADLDVMIATRDKVLSQKNTISEPV